MSKAALPGGGINVRHADLSTHGDQVFAMSSALDAPIDAALTAGATDFAGSISPLLRPVVGHEINHALTKSTKALQTTRDGVGRYGAAIKAVAHDLHADDGDNGRKLATAYFKYRHLGLKLPGSLAPNPNDPNVPHYDFGKLRVKPDVGRVKPPPDNPYAIDKPIVDIPINLRSEHDWFKGVGPVETARSDIKDIQKILQGNVHGGDVLQFVLDATATASTIQSVTTPAGIVGTATSAAAGWALEHIEPLPTLLDKTVCEPIALKAAAKTWSNVGNAVGTVVSDLVERVVIDLNGQESQAVNQYFNGFTSTLRSTEHLRNAFSNASAGMAGIAAIGGSLRDLVRSAYSAALGYAASLITSALLEDPVEAVEAIVRWVEQLVRLVTPFIYKAVTLTGKLVKDFKHAATTADNVRNGWIKAAPDLKT